MILVAFDAGATSASIIGDVYQYDYGQILIIQGINLPTAVRVDFSLDKTGGESLSRIGITSDNVTKVPIPDSMLENSDTNKDYYIYAYIVLVGENDAETKYVVKIKVRARSRPEVFERQEDVEIFREAIATVNASAISAKSSNISAEAWAHGHEEYPERDEDNAMYYAVAAKESANCAEQAAAQNGYMNFYIENGRLIETRTENVEVEFAMIEGRLCLL